MRVYVDTRQQAGKHDQKHSWLEAHGCELVRLKLDVGDYALAERPSISVDTKQNVDEIAQNIHGKNHTRFKNECIRARDSHVQLVVLIENVFEYEQIEDVARWTNTHCKTCRRRYERGCNPHSGGKCPRHFTNKPIQGPQLAKAMNTMQQRYLVRFQFCHPRESGQRILDLLTKGVNW